MQVGSMLGHLRLIRSSSQSFLASELMIFADDVERGADPDFELEVADAPTNLKTCTCSRLYVRTTLPILGKTIPKFFTELLASEMMIFADDVERGLIPTLNWKSQTHPQI